MDVSRTVGEIATNGTQKFPVLLGVLHKLIL